MILYFQFGLPKVAVLGWFITPTLVYIVLIIIVTIILIIITTPTTFIWGTNDKDPLISWNPERDNPNQSKSHNSVSACQGWMTRVVGMLV